MFQKCTKKETELTPQFSVCRIYLKPLIIQGAGIKLYWYILQIFVCVFSSFSGTVKLHHQVKHEVTLK